ncbi:MAG TPA: right-handed parallel beta-helix repeat-containing protein [Planctomicrobium sp.]|nr:right-handed parallel beta-helix repeat-containing protein [Planctomicrobium sp.]
MNTVRDFGVTGDGQTDDTDSLQHAINYSSGEVILPKGDYLITRPLVVDLNRLGRISFSGSGGTAKIIMQGPGPAIFFQGTHQGSADPKSFKPGVWNDERFPTVDGLEIEGQHPEADGIRIEGAVQVTLTRLLIRKVRTAIHVHKRARNILIDSCHIYYNTGIGIHFDELSLHQGVITSSHISYCRRGGIRIEGGDIRNLHITGNDIEYNNIRTHLEQFPDEAESPPETAEIYIDVRKGSVREGTIASNTIQATISKGGANIRLIGSDRDKGMFGLWSITGNLIGHQETNIHITNSWGVVVSGNNIYGATKRNIQVEGSRNVVINGNMLGQMPDFNRSKLCNGIRIENSIDCLISGVQIQDPQELEGAGPVTIPEEREALVELVNSDRVNVTGSQLLDGIPVGLLIDSCRETSVNNCQIIDQRDTPRMEQGVLLRGELKHVILSNNQIRRATVKAVAGTPHPGVIMTNNVTD